MTREEISLIREQVACLEEYSRMIATGELAGAEAANEIWQRCQIIRDHLHDRVTNDAVKAASAANGRKGGRPKKQS